MERTQYALQHAFVMWLLFIQNCEGFKQEISPDLLFETSTVSSDERTLQILKQFITNTFSKMLT